MTRMNNKRPIRRGKRISRMPTNKPVVMIPIRDKRHLTPARPVIFYKMGTVLGSPLAKPEEIKPAVDDWNKASPISDQAIE